MSHASTTTQKFSTDISEFVTFTVGHQLFGVPVLKVQDILVPQNVAPVPLATPEIRGSINLRGRIVTVIDMRRRLGLPEEGRPEGKEMGVTVEDGADLYTLLVDSVGDVVSLPAHLHEGNPSTLDPLWRDLAGGTYRLENKLMVILETDRVLSLPNAN